MDGALYLLAKPAAYDNLRALQSADAEKRLAVLSSECRAGNVQFLAATHFDGLKPAGALAVDAAALHKEEEVVVNAAALHKEEEEEVSRDSGGSGDECSSDDDKEQPAPASKVIDGNRSAAGRSGRWWCFSTHRSPGWLAVLAGPLLGSRGVLENMSGWNAAGKLLDPSLLGSSGSATITRLHASFALCQPGGRCGAHIQYSGDAHRQLARVGWA